MYIYITSITCNFKLLILDGKLAQEGPQLLRQYLYFCTSKASKPSTFCISTCTFVPVFVLL